MRPHCSVHLSLPGFDSSTDNHGKFISDVQVLSSSCSAWCYFEVIGWGHQLLQSSCTKCAITDAWISFTSRNVVPVKYCVPRTGRVKRIGRRVCNDSACFTWKRIEVASGTAAGPEHVTRVPSVPVLDSGGASAAKEPGHFEVRKSSSQVTQMHFFPPPSKHKGRQRRWDCFAIKIKQIKRSAVRYDKIFIFCSLYYQSKGIGRVKPRRWIFQPGHLL